MCFADGCRLYIRCLNMQYFPKPHCCCWEVAPILIFVCWEASASLGMALCLISLSVCLSLPFPLFYSVCVCVCVCTCVHVCVFTVVCGVCLPINKCVCVCARVRFCLLCFIAHSQTTVSYEQCSHVQWFLHVYAYLIVCNYCCCYCTVHLYN